MRVLMLGIVVAIAAIMPASTNADDQQIADFIKARLMQEKQQGNLFGFNVDMRVDQGTVWFKGFVSNRPQELMILRTAQLAGHLGVVQVVDDIEVNDAMNAQNMAPPMPQQQMMQQRMPQQRVAMNTMAPQGQSQRQPQLAFPSQMPQQQMQNAQMQQQQMMQQREMMQRSAQLPRTAAPMPQTQRQPMTPAMGQGQPKPQTNMPAAPRRMQMPLSDKDAPKVDENTQKVAYQEPIPQGYSPLNSANIQAPQSQLGPATQSLLNPVRAQQVSMPYASNAAPAAQPYAAAPAPTGPPLPFARAAAPAPQGYCDTGCADSYGGGGGPMPSGMGGGMGGGGGYDSANLPGYAWPAYAASPNYGAVSYPKQYSPSAWPYIGPFYPYPQVPLGWRKVALEWDDGWWYLDFHDKD